MAWTVITSFGLNLGGYKVKGILSKVKQAIKVFATALFASGVISCGSGGDDSGESTIGNGGSNSSRSGTRLQLTGRQQFFQFARESDSLGVALMHSEEYMWYDPGDITVSLSRGPNEDFLWARVFDEIEVELNEYPTPVLTWLDNSLIFSRVIDDYTTEITSLSPLDGSINWQLAVPDTYTVPYLANDAIVFSSRFNANSKSSFLVIGLDGQIKSNYDTNEVVSLATNASQWTTDTIGTSHGFFLSSNDENILRLALMDIQGNNLWAKKLTFPEYSNGENIHLTGVTKTINENMIFVFRVEGKILLLSIDAQSGNPQW